MLPLAFNNEHDEEICVLCNLAEPQQANVSDIMWVDCEFCQKWAHVVCLPEASSIFICSQCLNK